MLTLIRDRGQLHKEVLQHRERMRKLLITMGCWDGFDHRTFAKRLASGKLVCHDGTPLPSELHERLLREAARLALAEEQLAALERTLQERLPAPVRERIAYLTHLKGVGHIGASRLMLELFWRQFGNRRQLGACVGLVPQPYDSGQSRIDQGISKQGNRRVRTQLVEMAWCWLRYQPSSALAQWFNKRTQGTGANRRARRIAIVALARRLVIALWRYLKDGVIPQNAQFKGVRREISRFPCKALACMPGSTTTPDRQALAMSRPLVLPSTYWSASASGISTLSWLHGWPTHSPADASLTSSRMPAHGSGAMWLAMPSS